MDSSENVDPRVCQYFKPKPVIPMETGDLWVYDDIYQGYKR